MDFKPNTKWLAVDYHFHPNLPRSKRLAQQKIKKLYTTLEQAKIDIVVVTEHVYKNPARAYRAMAQYKPSHITLFPGLEYTTQEGIDIIIFARDESLYDIVLPPPSV